MTANITLRLDEKTLRRIKHLAVEQQRSVSAWVGELVRRSVDELDGYAEARESALRAMQNPVALREGVLTRDETHRR